MTAKSARKKNGLKSLQMNCWEFYHCPVERQLLCPAFTLSAGRACWLIAGTLCGGTMQGGNAKRLGRCHLCDFYSQVSAGKV